ncbi:iron chelate uptake ABC transporter family permease subunit [Streptomyces phaeoluteigriseus]|uniref:Iron chelate uptake ABC transporter family permease subunit n=1 Tax=Streptomyces phaeoluteigriseus TaxID=114686 RepID=A0ABY4Z7P3_9ACTN|nr:iron chelate uptake ABC transporter family permease subunit [Streptomyces phaeoluteigriseus]USQ85079.1 iron chelate uptake ABC transporter family permease subunit [Streptomyces phaeoluteigriseus]
MSVLDVPRTTGVVRTGRWSLRYRGRTLLICAATAALAAFSLVLALGTGSYALTPAEVVRTLFGEGPPGAGFIVRDLRLPRALVAVLVGFGMGLAGAVFQSLTRNPLGSPDITGFGNGASAGALVAIILFDAGAPQTALGAVCGGLATAAAVYLLAWKRGVHGYRLVLVGIGASAVLGSATSFLYVRADIGKAAQAASWMIGSLNARDWTDVRVAALGLVLTVPLVLAYARRLSLLEMGDDTAAALGVPPERSRLVLLCAATGLTAMTVAAAGPIPFVAMAAPQLARRVTRAAGPNLLPAAWTGALLVSAADLVTQRLTGSALLPVGVVTGVAGGAYLAWLLRGERGAGRI